MPVPGLGLAQPTYASQDPSMPQHVLPLGMSLRIAASLNNPPGSLPPNFPTVPTPMETGWRVTGMETARGFARKGHAADTFAGEDHQQALTQQGLRGDRQQVRPTLRTYLEALRGKDSRCVLVARRINKFGFKSKSILQEHFSQFGKVVRVHVAHSKVKPLGEEGASRTRPGNLGLVIMSSAESVLRALAQGSLQTVMGVQIQVHQFEHSQMEKESEEDIIPAGLALTSVPQKQPWKNDDGSGNEDGSEGSQSTLDSIPGAYGRKTTASSVGSSQMSTGWGRQTSSGSAGSMGGTGDGSVAAGPPHGLNNEPVPASPPRGLNLTRVPVAASPPGGLNSTRVPVAASPPRDLNNAPVAASPGGTACPINMPPHLFGIIDELRRIAKDPMAMKHMTRDQAIHAAAMAQWAQQSLEGMKFECQQKMAELSYPPVPTPPPVPPLPQGPPGFAFGYEAAPAARRPKPPHARKGRQ
jgi:hypothetical protein